MLYYGEYMTCYDLQSIGCTDDAIALNYTESDSEYYYNKQSNEITELLQGVEFICTLPVNAFVESFNDLSFLLDE